MNESSQPVKRGAWDRVGIVTSTACAVHCTLLPLVAGLLPLLGLQHLADERLEWLFIAVAGVVGMVGHARAYLRHHRHVGPGVLFAAGLGAVIATRLSGVEHVIEPVVLGIGGLAAAAAHWANLRLCRCCDRCAAAADASPPVISRTAD